MDRMTPRDFEILAATLRPRMLRAALSILDDTSDAEDTVQDAMLKLWSLRDRLDGLRSAEAFAVVVTRRMAINVLRRRRPECRVTLSDDIASIPSAEEELIGRQSEGSVDSILGALPESWSTLIRLRHIEGYDNAAIAVLLGSSEGAVRTALSRARRRVAELFAAKGRGMSFNSDSPQKSERLT